MSEADLHLQVAKFLMLALPAAVPWSTFPAGGGGKARGGQLKARGLRSGWPDIILVHPLDGRLCGIELKTEAGRVSAEQKAAHTLLVNAGALIAVCRSMPAVEGTLIGWGFPLRARLS